MKTAALGLIEVKGYVGAIEAADAALKAANVTLIKLERIRSGLVTVLLSGDVGAIKAAVDAGKEAAKKCGTLISTHVIARPHEETTKVLVQPKVDEVPAVELETEVTVAVEPHTEIVTGIETDSEAVSEADIELIYDPIPAEELILEEDTHLDREVFDADELEGKKVEELRKLARKLHIKNVKPNEIKYGRKEFLIQLLTDYSREGASE